ncbi:hypothetical protein LIER_08165 [Lithospermum erythrorhizon]|uniref:Integrase catalytic domain-containing protein n=1 Tax=Lithospermum erythrorhizon TaxID=34254 RepID=A0AAV3PBL2_LITER
MSSEPKRKSKVLDLVHSDVCGKVKTRSLGGAYYFLTFIDDYSRIIWAYTLKTKDQVLDTFKLFQASVQRETGKKLKCIRTDNGEEYIGPFDEYCREQVIHHQKSPPKTPRLNGYGLDEFGYRFFDPVQRKLIHNLDVVFMEDYTIEDIDKVEKEDLTFEDEKMVNTDSTTTASTPIIFDDSPIENQGMDLNVENVLNPNDFVDVETRETNVENEVDHEVESVEQPIVFNELRRSTRDRRPSIRY